MNKKAGTPIDILILVLIAVGLSVGCLYIFYLNGNYVSAKISDSRFLDSVYVKENQINFYTEDIVDKSLIGINNKENPIPEFIENLKIELGKYKTSKGYVIPELAQLENQINNENIEFIDNEIKFSFNINLKQDFENKFSVNYNYKKIIKKKLI
jgi:hypothetical protein